MHHSHHHRLHHRLRQRRGVDMTGGIMVQTAAVAVAVVVDIPVGDITEL
jgi:hypothetical protein